jgi:hypothetical protein
MPTTALKLGTGLVSSADYPYSIVIAGIEVAPTHAVLESIEFQDNGDDETGTLDVRLWDPASTLAIREQGVIHIQENSSDQQVWAGIVQRRWYSPAAIGRYVNIEGVSLSTLLDEMLVVRELRPIESDQARALYLWGKYARWPLSGDVQFVTETNAALPRDDLVNMTLRSALRQTAGLAGSTVRMAIDAMGRLHWFAGSETNPAPYGINVALTPGGGNIAPDDLFVERDATVKNRAYVRGANAVGSGWFQNDASVAAYGPRETYIDAPSADTSAKANSIARLYFGRMAEPRTRGRFSTEEPYNGWRAGQNVTITDPQNDLAAQAFRLARVTTRFTKGTGTKRYVLEFGSVRAAGSEDAGVYGTLGASLSFPGAVVNGELTIRQTDTSGIPTARLVFLDELDRKIGVIAANGSRLSISSYIDDVEDGDVELAPRRNLERAIPALVASSAIPSNCEIAYLDAASNITLTSTPTIDAGLTDQILHVMNVSGSTITLQDRGTLGGSNLYLTTATVTLGTYDSITFICAVGTVWVEIARSNVL